MPAKLKVSHQGDVGRGVVQRDGHKALAVGVFTFRPCLKRDGRHGVEIAENVGIAGLAAPIEVRRDEFALGIRLQPFEGLVERVQGTRLLIYIEVPVRLAVNLDPTFFHGPTGRFRLRK